MQLLAILKPDGTLRRAAGAGMLNGLRTSNLCQFVTFRKVQVPLELVERHYEHVRSRNFYPWLAKYMTTGPSYVALLEAEASSIQPLRDLLGSTRAHQAQPGTLRYNFAPYGGANCVHLSDSEEAAAFEVPLWKSTFGISEGQFDVSVDEFISKYLDGPNNTIPLREICSEIASKGQPVSEADRQRIQELVASECYDATPDEVDAVAWTITESCVV